MSKTSIIVEGWIQSVGLRSFVKRVAAQLGLNGLVRNLPDGTVELFCEGSASKIDAFLKMLDYKGEKDDPLSAYVEKLMVYHEGDKGYSGPWKPYVGFEIDYGFEVASPVDRALMEHLESGTLYVASSRDGFRQMKDEFSQMRDEFSMFRKETNSNFGTMEDKYGSISKEIEKMRATLEKLVEAYIKKQN